MRYQKGDKVVIREDLKVGKKYGNITWLEGMEPMKSMLFTTILGVGDKGSYVLDTGWCVSEEMISHKYEEELSVWYCEDDKYAHVLCCDGSIFTINKASDNGDTLNNILERPTDSFLLTLEEAEKSAIYLVLKRVKVNKPKMYYICMGLGDFKYVNYDVVSGEYFLSTKEETENERTMFTEEEADKIVGTNSILTKEEVG